MLRRTFLGILAAIPFWRKAKAEKPKLEYRITPLTGPAPVRVVGFPIGGYVQVIIHDGHCTLTILPPNGDNRIRLKMGEWVRLPGSDALSPACPGSGQELGGCQGSGRLPFN